jgi:hypothetical protein
VPFTLSHAVAVLPLTRGGRLVPAALVIGAWVPDLPYFVPGLGHSAWTHGATGPVSIDLVLGLLVLALWQQVLRRPLVDLSPAWLRDRLPPPRRLTGRSLGWAALSVVLGALTHVVWDTFSHPRRWGTTHVPVLTELRGGLPLYKWFQFGSGVLGLAGLAVWVALWARRTRPRPGASPLRAPLRLAAWLGATVVFLVAGTASAWSRLHAGAGIESAAVGFATASMGTTAAAVVLLCLGWPLLGPDGSGRRLRQAGGVGEGPAQRRQR